MRGSGESERGGAAPTVKIVPVNERIPSVVVFEGVGYALLPRDRTPAERDSDLRRMLPLLARQFELKIETIETIS